MKKKLIILIIFIALLPLAFMSGKSSWIILDEVDKEIDNTYYPVAVAPTFNEVYDGNYKEITVEDCSSATVKYDPSLLLIEYYDSANKKIGNKRANKPVNAGVYYAKTYYNSKLIGTTEMVIQEYPIYVVPNSYEISFGDATSSIDPGYRLCDLASGSYVERELFTNVEAGTRDTLNLIKGESFNYTYTYKQYANVGSYEIGIDIINESVLNPNYSVTVGTSSELNVRKRALGFSWNQLEYTYDGTIHTPSITISNNLTEPHALKPIINGNVLKDAGTYPVTLQKEYDNFILNGDAADFSRNVVINKRNVLKGGASWGNTALTYNGKPQAPTITFDNIVAGEAVAPVYEYYSGATKLAGMPTNAGSYIVKLTGISGADSKNYTFTPLEQSFTIERAMPNKPEVATLQAKVGDLLSSVKLPEGFSLRGYQPTDKFTSEGRQNINVIYNPDSNNYKDLNTTLVVDVIKADAKVISVAIESATITYDGSPHKLSYTLKLNGEPIEALPSGVTLTIWFSDTATDCTNAGVYMVKRISLVGEGYELDGASKAEATKASLTINPLEIEISGNVELNYNKNLTTWTDIKNTIATTIKFQNLNGDIVNLPTQAFTILGIQNGVYSYGNATKTLDQSMQYVVGSVYQGNLELNDKNYAITNTLFTLYYRTVKSNNRFYTIEEAIINETGLIRLEGSSSAYCPTSFTMLSYDEGNPFIKAGKPIRNFVLNSRTLLVPFKDNSNADIEKGAAGAKTVYSVLIVPNGITIEFKGSYLNIGAKISSTTTVNQHGVVMNEGKLIFHSGSYLNSYGFLKGKTGTVEIKPGATAVDCMKVYDWPGGTNAVGVVSKAFPLNSWTLHNISCNTIVNNGGLYKAQIYIETSLGNADAQIMVLGGMNDTKCLFRPSVKTGGFVTKYVTKALKWDDTHDSAQALYSITGDNQINGQKDIIEINGNYVDGSLSITVAGVSVSTTTSKPAPLSYIDVKVNSNSNLNLTNSDYLFFPGTTVTIEKDAVVSIGANVDLCFMTAKELNESGYANGEYSFKKKCIDYDYDAKMIVNGTFISNGNVGGHIESNQKGAILNLAGGKTSATYTSLCKTGTFSLSYKGTIASFGMVEGATGTPNLAAKVYEADNSSDGTVKFKETSNYKEFKLEFYDENNNFVYGKSIYIVNQTTYTFTGSEYSLDKEFYDFTGWMDEQKKPASGLVLQDSNKIYKFYATFNIHTYTFNYLAGNDLKANGDVNYVEAVYANKLESFTINDFVDKNVNGLVRKTLDIPTTATYNNMPYCYGWYLGMNNEMGIRLKAIDIDLLRMLIKSFGSDVSFNLFCNFTETPTYNVLIYDSLKNLGTYGFIGGFDLKENQTIKSIGKEVKLDFEAFDINEEYDKYFNNFVDELGNPCILDEILNTRITQDRVFTVAWGNKYKIDFQDDTGVVVKTLYAHPNNDMTLSIGIVKNRLAGNSYDTVYTFDKWTCLSDNKDYAAGTKYSAKGDTVFKAKFTEKYIKKLTIEIKEDATVKIDGVTCANGQILEYSFDTVDGFKDLNIEVVRTTEGLTVTWVPNVGNSKTLQEKSRADYTGVERLNCHTTLKAHGSCITSGTLITLADGSTKKVEDLLVTDVLRVFNHETGKYEASPIIFIEEDGVHNYEVINLKFSNGTTSRLIYEHAYFDLSLNKYVYITNDNYKEYLGDSFAFDSNNSSGYNSSILIDAYITNENVGCYSLITVHHMNFIVDGLLSIPGGIDGLFNIFEYDNDTLQYNHEKMKADIEKYGLYTYDDFKDYVPYEVYMAFPAPYFKVAVGKGMISYNQIIVLFKEYFEAGKHNVST